MTTPANVSGIMPPAIAYDCGDEVLIKATNRERTSWAVRLDDLWCLNSNGEWEDEWSISDRSDEFLARTRWPSAESAWAALLRSRAMEMY